jgi:hypothetical protein
MHTTHGKTFLQAFVDLITTATWLYVYKYVCRVTLFAGHGLTLICSHFLQLGSIPLHAGIGHISLIQVHRVEYRGGPRG